MSRKTFFNVVDVDVSIRKRVVTLLFSATDGFTSVYTPLYFIVGSVEAAAQLLLARILCSAVEEKVNPPSAVWRRLVELSHAQPTTHTFTNEQRSLSFFLSLSSTPCSMVEYSVRPARLTKLCHTFHHRQPLSLVAVIHTFLLLVCSPLYIEPAVSIVNDQRQS